MLVKYKRRNWKELQKKFIKGHYTTLKEFAIDEELNYKSSQFFVNTKGWLKIKEIINMNPLLLEKYDQNLNKLLEDIPHYFYTFMQSKLENAAATYIQDTRYKPCTLDEIAGWYDLNIVELKGVAEKERWEYLRKKEREGKYGYAEYLEMF